MRKRINKDNWKKRRMINIKGGGTMLEEHQWKSSKIMKINRR
jgi:hypothetical protein